MSQPLSRSSISQAPYGHIHGQDVALYTLTSDAGLVMKVTNYGAIVTELHVPDRAGKFADVVAGLDSVDAYAKDSPYFGTIAGRVANRIRNAEFELAGERYKVLDNDGVHHLHGGKRGFDKVVWKATPVETPRGPSLELTYISKDGEEGYPGTLKVCVVYTLTHENEFRVDMSATTDRTTLANFVQHTYWNIGGIGSGTVEGHELTLHASHYTPGDPVVPTGAVVPVRGTPFDFTESKLIGRDLQKTMSDPIGYDHNWVVDGDPRAMRPVAKLRDHASGRAMILTADQPGVQLYSGNYLDGSLKGKGVTYVKHAALCLETQVFPNAINIPAWRNDVILHPGQTYQHAMVHKFVAE